MTKTSKDRKKQRIKQKEKKETVRNKERERMIVRKKLFYFKLCRTKGNVKSLNDKRKVT